MYACLLRKNKNLQSKNHKVRIQLWMDIVVGAMYLFIRRKTALYFMKFSGKCCITNAIFIVVQMEVARTETRQVNWLDTKLNEIVLLKNQNIDFVLAIAEKW